MKKINIPLVDYKTKVIVEKINELLEELAKKGIIELEDDSDGSSKD